MPIPILIQSFTAFLGDSQAESTFTLADTFSPGGSKNLWVDRRGQIRPIDGYSKLTITPLVTNVGASAATLRSMFPFKKTEGGTITRQLLGVLDDGVNEWEIWKSLDTGATWTFISDRGATPVGQYPDWVQFGDLLYITVPKTEIPRVWNGAALSAAGGTQLAAPVIADALVTGVLSGSFQWRIVPVKSDGTEKIGSVASDATNLTLTQADVTWIADTDVDVVGYNAYRTTGVGKIFYLSTYVDDRTTVTFRDNVDDLVLIRHNFLDAHGDAPPTGVYFAVQHKGRVWWIRTDDFPRTAFWSDPGLADSVWQDRNFVDCSNAGDDTSMGDVSTGGTGEFGGLLVIWLEKSVWVVSGDGQIVGAIINFNLRRTDAQTGTVSHRSVARIPAGARTLGNDGQFSQTSSVALAYFTPLADIRLFDGNSDTVISHPKAATLARLTYSARAKVHMSHDTQRSHVVWYLPVDGGTECSLAVAWDYKNGLWYEWPTTPFASVILTDTTNAAQVIVASQANVATGGYTYQLWNGNTFDGTAIMGQWMTKPLYMSGPSFQGSAQMSLAPDVSRVKRHRFYDLIFSKLTTKPVVSIDVLPPDALDTDLALFTVPVEGSSIQRANLQDGEGRFHHDVGIRLRIKSSASTGPWTLQGAALGYQILPGIFYPER